MAPDLGGVQGRCLHNWLNRLSAPDTCTGQFVCRSRRHRMGGRAYGVSSTTNRSHLSKPSLLSKATTGLGCPLLNCSGKWPVVAMNRDIFDTRSCIVFGICRSAAGLQNKIFPRDFLRSKIRNKSAAIGADFSMRILFCGISATDLQRMNVPLDYESSACTPLLCTPI